MWLGSKIFRRGKQGDAAQAQTPRDPDELGTVHAPADGAHDPATGAERGVHWGRQVPHPTAPPVDSRGRLAISEFTFDKAAAPSPFGDDVTFPLPAEGLNYSHPEQPPAKD